MRPWRRTARVVPFSAPVLLTSTYVTATRQLTLVFDREIVVTGAFGAANLVVFTGSGRAEWQSTLSVVGNTLITQHAVPVLDFTAPGVRYLGVPMVVRDLRGTLWPPGTYALTTIV